MRLIFQLITLLDDYRSKFKKLVDAQQRFR